MSIEDGASGETTTYLLTDVVGSTSRWEAEPAAMASALARHDELIEAAAAATGGALLRERGEGDSRFLIFQDPRAAATAALTIVTELRAQSWPTVRPLQVRIGLHTAHGAGGQYGTEVNRAIRLRGVAHPDQVLLSGTTAESLADWAPAGCHLVDQGAHRLLGSATTERVVQLCHPEVTPHRPFDVALEGARNNLPEPTTELVGRDGELARLRDVLGESRLVTLTGTGGSGKTRLALALAREARTEAADGVWLVELAPLSDPSLLPQALASVLGVQEAPGQAHIDTVAATLGTKAVLVVLDNCEHVRAAAADTARVLLGACPRLRILATSREPLGLAGEATWNVPPLATPPAGLADPEKIRAYSAVALFLIRAEAASPGFTLASENAGPLGELCRRLDGIPLALELTAARLRQNSLGDVVAGLTETLRDLGPNDSDGRQRTLAATLAWSHGLLSPPEQALFRRVAVFAGGGDADAAEEVAAGHPVHEDHVWDLLGALVDKSLLIASPQGETTRYVMLETVRAYARGQLADSGEDGPTHSSLLSWMLSIAEACEPGLGGAPGFRTSMQRMRTERDNLRAALEWSQTAGWPAAGIQLVACAGTFWWAAGSLREGKSWVEAALAVQDRIDPGTRAKLLQYGGQFALGEADYRTAVVRFEESIACARHAGDSCTEARSLSSMAWALDEMGKRAAARPVWEEGLAVARSAGDDITAAQILHNMGYTASAAGDLLTGERLLTEALDLARQRENEWQLAYTLNDLGLTVAARGAVARGLSLCEEGLSLARQVNDTGALLAAVDGVAQMASARGDVERAQTLWREGLTLASESGNQFSALACLEGLGQIAADLGRADLAARLLGAAEAWRRSSGIPRAPVRAGPFDHARELAMAALGNGDFQEAWSSGLAMVAEEAVGLARQE